MSAFFRYVPYMWKAVIAYLATLGISIPYADLLQAIDVGQFLKVLVSQGWKPAVLSLIPAILVYLKDNKQDKPVVHSNVAHMGS